MPIVFSYDGKTLDIDDVPLAVYGEIEKQTKVPWYDLSSAPLRHAIAGEMLAQECGKILGVDVPPLTPRKLVEMFKAVKDENRPTGYTDGMPDPKAEDSEPATT